MDRKVTGNGRRVALTSGIMLLLTGVIALTATYTNLAAQERSSDFVGGLQPQQSESAAKPRPVRNDVAQPGEEIVTRRYFRIKKGAFPQFYEASEQGVWPYFEKLGARVIGMWKVVHPPFAEVQENPEYDEVILMTRYASLDHWQATRETVEHGGNGPDWDRCKAALDYRRSVTQETNVIFLEGHVWHNDPWFLPGLDETYERVEP